MGIVDALAKESARGSGFETAHLEAELTEAVAQCGDGISHATAGLIAKANVEQAAHECSGGDDDRAGAKTNPEVCFHTDGDVILHEQARDISLLEMETRLLLERGLHAELVCLLVALRAGRSHARPFASIQHSKLDAGGVGIDSHGTAERIDLTDHVTFGESAHGRIARHLADGVGILSKHQRLTTEA